MNESLSTLSIEVASAPWRDGGPPTRLLEPGESIDIVSEGGIGQSARDPSEWVESITIRDGDVTLYDGAVAAPPFALTRYPSGRSDWSSVVYTFTATP